MKLCHRSAGNGKTKKKVNGKTFRREQVLHHAPFTQSRKNFPFFGWNGRRLAEFSKLFIIIPAFSFHWNLISLELLQVPRKKTAEKINEMFRLLIDRSHCYRKLCDFLSMIHNESLTEYKVADCWTKFFEFMNFFFVFVKKADPT